MSDIGKRLERILFFGVALAGVAFFLLAVAFGLKASSDRALTRGYAAFATLIENNHSDFQSKWDDARAETISYQANYKWAMYDLAYSELATKHYLTSEHLVDISDKLSQFIGAIGHQSPDEVIAHLKDNAKKLTERPALVYGINIPRQIVMDVGGNHVTSSLDSMEIILQCVGAPLLILWLGAYIGTRGREVEQIQASAALSQVYPHLLNVYPVLQDKVVKKKEKLSPDFAIFLCKIFRLSIIFMLIFPPIISYSISVIIYNELWLWFIPAFIIFFFQLLIAILIECIGSARNKIFYASRYRHEN